MTAPASGPTAPRPAQADIRSFFSPAAPETRFPLDRLDRRWLAAARTPRHARWTSLTVLEDWIRLCLLPRLANCPQSLVRSHTPPGIRSRIIAVAPLPPDFDLAGATSLALRSLLNEPLRVVLGVPPHTDAWPFAARYLRSLATDGWEITGSQSKGLGVSSVRPLALGALPGMWGLPVPLPQDASPLLSFEASFAHRTLLRGDTPREGPSPPTHLLLGPLNLLNHGCATHARVLPDLDPERRPVDPSSGLSPTDWRSAYLARPSPAGAALLISYSDEDPLPCPGCAPEGAPAPTSPDPWRAMVKEAPSWGPAALGADWAVLALLLPACSDSTPGLADAPSLTHVPAAVRAAMLAELPPLREIQAALGGMRTPAQRASALQARFQSRLQTIASLLPLEPRAHLSAWSSFWGMVARYVTECDVGPPSRRPPATTPVLTPDGLALSSNGQVNAGECHFPLTAELHFISRPHLDLLMATPSASRGQIVMGAHGPLLQIGPLSLVANSCAPHANLFPQRDPDSDEDLVPSADEYGLPQSFFRTARSLSPLANGQLLLLHRGSPESHPPPALDPAPLQLHPGCPLCQTLSPAPQVPETRLPRRPPALQSTTEVTQRPAAPLSRCPPPNPRKRRTPKTAPSPSGDRARTGAHPLFRVGTFNVRLTKRHFHHRLNTVLRAAYTDGISAFALTETCALPAAIRTTPDGVAERALVAGSHVVRFMSLWSFMPPSRSAGAGCTLLWDARIPYSDPRRDPNGRFTAVTLHGPGPKAVRIIGVYAYAAPRSEGTRPSELRASIATEIREARALGHSVVLAGDLQQSPPGDSHLDRPTGYPPAASIVSLCTSVGLRDAFRLRHPEVDGATFGREGQRLGRIDSVWFSAKLLGSPCRSLATIRAYVDVGHERLWAGSDHLMTHSAIRFERVFGAKAEQVRSDQRRATVLRVSIAHLHGPALDDFRASCLRHPKSGPLKETLKYYRANCSRTNKCLTCCTCPPTPPPQNPAHVNGTAHQDRTKIGKVSVGPPPAPPPEKRKSGG